jgi:nucleoid DNA-binding protein
MADDFMKAMSDDADDEGKGGLGGMLGKAASMPGKAKGVGGSALGGLGSVLGAATGAGGDLVGMLGNLAGMSADKLQSMPVVGDIIKTLASKLGIPTAQAAALVSGAITMLTSKMKRSNVENLDDIDFDDWDAEFAEESDVVSQVAEETGMDEEQVAEGMQEAMKMIAEADAAEE